MSWLINGLPVHVLLVHFVVVVVPLAAVVVLLVGVWPAAQRKIGILSPVIAFIALVSVPITTHAGEELQRMVGHTELIEEHVRLGDTLLPWAALVFFLAVVHWAWFRFVLRDGARFSSWVSRRALRTAITVVLAVAMAVTAVGSVVAVVIIGESGSRAVWTGELDSTR